MNRRLPYEPLERLLRVAFDAPGLAECGQPGKPGHGYWTAAAAARMLDVNRRTIVRWHTTGLTSVAADRAATRLGLHPLEVWGTAWEST